MQIQRNVRASSRGGLIFLLLFGSFWTVISAIVLVAALVSGERGGALFAACFLLPGLIILGYAATVYYSRARFGRPEVMVSTGTARLGETITVTLQHTFRRQVKLEYIRLQLLFRETATYQQGTDTRTVTHNEVFEQFELPGGPYYAGQTISESYHLHFPVDGMHTLNVRRNRLQWFVHLEAGIPKLPDYVDEYEITVLPEVVAAGF